MHKFLVALAILGVTSVPAAAQTAPATTNPTQPAKPQMVKKRVCEQVDEDPYSRLGSRKICKTIEVPADGAATNGRPTSAPAPANNSGN